MMALEATTRDTSDACHALLENPHLWETIILVAHYASSSRLKAHAKKGYWWC